LLLSRDAVTSLGGTAAHGKRGARGGDLGSPDSFGGGRRNLRAWRFHGRPIWESFHHGGGRLGGDRSSRTGEPCSRANANAARRLERDRHPGQRPRPGSHSSLSGGGRQGKPLRRGWGKPAPTDEDSTGRLERDRPEAPQSFPR